MARIREPLALLAVLLPGCANQTPDRIIEPQAPSEDEFVLTRKTAGGAATSSGYEIHLAEKWFPFRGQKMGLSAEEAMTRDGAFTVQGPGLPFWDPQTAVEAVSIWSVLCNECHGGRRKKEDAASMPPPKPGWGKGEGLFFGKRRAYKDIFGIITGGGPERNGKPSEMPSWAQKLSKEQIWSVIYFLEYQSGGIEGTFPPSLYPRGPEGVN